VKCNLLTSNSKGLEYDIYQVCPKCCLIVAFFIFFCANTFLKMFHFIVACKSPRPPFKNSWTSACGVYIYMHIQWNLICTSMSLTLLPHQVHIWNWWLCKVLDLYTLRLGNLSHDYDYPKCALQEKNPCQNP